MTSPSDLFQAPVPGRLGFGLPPAANAPTQRPDFDANAEVEQRRVSTSAGDYVGAIWRQDGIADGFVAELAGSGLEVDPDYNPFKDPEWSAISAGISDEFLPYLGRSHSKAHALYTRERLLQKQKDQGFSRP